MILILGLDLREEMANMMYAITSRASTKGNFASNAAEQVTEKDQGLGCVATGMFSPRPVTMRENGSGTHRLTWKR